MSGPNRSKVAQSADKFIRALDGVTPTDKDSFRIGRKVFVRMERDAEVPIYQFKLTRPMAASFCEEHEFVSPMEFGNMGTKGWISFRLTQSAQLPVLYVALEQSRSMFEER